MGLNSLSRSHYHTPGPSLIPKVRVLEFADGDINSAGISRLSLSKKKMVGFSYYGSRAVQPVTSYIVSELLESSQHSLQKFVCMQMATEDAPSETLHVSVRWQSWKQISYLCLAVRIKGARF